MSIDVSANNAI